MKRAAFALSLLSLAPLASLAAGCGVAAPVAPQGDQLSWDGPCKDGLAEGRGTLHWRRSGKPALTYQVTMAHGAIDGPGYLQSANGDWYYGPFRDGVPNGQGHFRYANGNQYKGDVVDGLPDGTGASFDLDETCYDGEWKNGLRDGVGRITYTLGGSYEGEWKQGKFDGHGVITYAGSGRREEGEFKDGRLAGAPLPAAAASRQYAEFPDTYLDGHRDPRWKASTTIPPRKPWGSLTPAQQALVRAAYPALAPADEPPYPLDPAGLLDDISKEGHTSRVLGELKFYVLVGADGTAKSVKVLHVPYAEMREFLADVVMRERFKPAVCDGKPCAMFYPMSFSFVH